MNCPSALCREQMEVDGTLQAILGEKHRETFDSATLRRFCELQLRRKLNAEPDLVWCKASGCGSAQIHIGGGLQAEHPVVVCHSCSARACFTHDMPWHEGKTCEEFTKELKRSSRWKQETKRNDKWLKRNTKLCPGEGCGRLVEKRGGCDHMVCRPPGGCGHEFCWRCLAPYQPIRQQGKKLHRPNCKHYK
ncbi:hypothetical protein FRC12_006963 [Ceratobasidium sp. 428]|nr:hypothetical protein FRC12_006963 [Ceratobasidium sp. 428]